MEWQAWKDSLCSGCGNPRHESFRRDGPEYEATLHRCRACEARAVRGRRLAEDEKSSTAGAYIAVTEVD